MRERRLTVAAVVLLLLAAAWGHQPAVVVATDTRAAAVPTAAQAELDLGALGVLALSWTAKRIVAR